MFLGPVTGARPWLFALKTDMTQAARAKLTEKAKSKEVVKVKKKSDGSSSVSLVCNLRWIDSSSHLRPSVTMSLLNCFSNMISEEWRA